MPAIAVVRIRGHMRIRRTIEDSMKRLQLTRANHCVVVPATPEVLGMVQKAKDYVTWGSLGAADIEALIRTRGRLEGDAPMTDTAVKERTPYATIAELAAAVHAGKVRYGQIKGVTPIFRLQPPKQGFKGGNKRSVPAHGNLGFRGEAMSALLKRMM